MSNQKTKGGKNIIELNEVNNYTDDDDGDDDDDQRERTKRKSTSSSADCSARPKRKAVVEPLWL